MIKKLLSKMKIWILQKGVNSKDWILNSTKMGNSKDWILN